MQGRVVIVTGGAKGIGRHAAHTLAKAGPRSSSPTPTPSGCTRL